MQRGGEGSCFRSSRLWAHRGARSPWVGASAMPLSPFVKQAADSLNWRQFMPQCGGRIPAMARGLVRFGPGEIRPVFSGHGACSSRDRIAPGCARGKPQEFR